MSIEYDHDRDWHTVSGLRAMLHDARDMLRVANQENRELEQAVKVQQEFSAGLYLQLEEIQQTQDDLQNRLDSLASRIQ